MDINTRMELISRRPTEEVQTVDELRLLLETKATPTAYNGFEPSGLMHLGTGLLSAQKIRDLTDAGVRYKVLLATWHAKLNGKYDGNIDKIREVAEYFIEGWKSLGVNESMVEFVTAEELVAKTEYWELLLRISEQVTLSSVVRALPIMGRRQSDSLRLGAYVYPLMQVTDIFRLEADITQLGMDQRKANMLAKEVGPKLGLWSPVAVHHHLLTGLRGPAKLNFDDDTELDIEISSKMAKSKPNSSILIHDSEDAIRQKIAGAFCPERVVEGNPVLDYAKNLILRSDSDWMRVERPSAKGGAIEVNWPILERQYAEGGIHPSDVKGAVASSLIKLLEPARKHFESKLGRIQEYLPQTGEGQPLASTGSGGQAHV